MIAQLLRGHLKGVEVEVHSMCNDWVMLRDYKQPVSPDQIAFLTADMSRMLQHKEDYGFLFTAFELIKRPTVSRFMWSFRKRREEI